MASLVPESLARLLAYVQSRSYLRGPAQPPAWQESPQRSRGQIDASRRHPGPGTFDLYYTVAESSGDAFSLPSNESLGRTSGEKREVRTLAARGKQCALRVKNTLCVTFVFVWTVVMTVFIVVWAASSYLLLDNCRKQRDISNNVVLVTNAGRGLGRRLAIILALKAALVVCWDPDQERHMNTVYDIRHRGGRALGFTVDVCDEAAVTDAAEAMRRQVGLPGIVVMSAGRRLQRPLLHWTPDDLEAIYRANVTPHLVLLRTFLPEMLARNDGHLVCIISASVPCWYDAAYAATKVGVAALMRGLADELETNPGNKVQLTCVYPHHMERQTPLSKMATVVVNDVLRGRKSVVVPKYTVFWLNLLRILPVVARRKWCSFMARLSRKTKTGFEEAYCPCSRHNSMLAMLTSQTPHSEGFISCAPYEMASCTSFDNVPLVLRKQKADDFVEESDSVLSGETASHTQPSSRSVL